MSLLFEKIYNPDILNCLANLSNDELFTPPEVVNKMLDMLPQELFKSPDTTFLEMIIPKLIQFNDSKKVAA
jgi:site-specific DNA-methyltransferase (adenine-specific)